MIKLDRYNKRYLLKVAEEAAELTTAIAKLLLWRDQKAWSDFLDELTDLKAAIRAWELYNRNAWLREARFNEKLKKIKEQVEQ